MTREELIARVEGLTGEDASVDALLADYLYGPSKVLDGYGYTGSVDAVLALIQERLPGCYWELARGFNGKFRGHITTDRSILGNAATPALAFLAATLRALPDEEVDG